MPTVYRPNELNHALSIAANASADGPLTILAGGTDIYPAHVGRPLVGDVLDLTGVSALQTIELVALSGQPHLRLGAAVRWSALARRQHAALDRAHMGALVMAAQEIGGLQIQNQGTIVGNLCNASPAADGVPALQALDAKLRIASENGSRIVTLVDFITGPRRTTLQAGELVEAIFIPLPDKNQQSHSLFLKLGHRRYLVISAVMAALRLDWAESRVVEAAVSIGSCGPVALRLSELEGQLIGCSASELAEFADQPIPAPLLAGLSPIDDLRGSAHYRMDAAQTIVRRALRLMADAPGSNAAPTKGMG